MEGKPPDLNQLLQTASDIRQRPVLIFCLPDEPIEKKHLLQTGKLLKNKHFEAIDLVIHSGGGDIGVAYQIAELLHLKNVDMAAVIPFYAKSAATLLCLGTTEIIMGEFAELGPLDTQILETKDGRKGYSSALNPFKTLEQLRSFSLETMDSTIRLILERAEIGIDQAIKHGVEFSTKISTPLLDQLSSEKLGEYSRALSIGYEYGKRLLVRYGKFNEEKAEGTLTKLIWGYPSHDYIIDQKELAEIGLPSKLCSKECYENLSEIGDALLSIQKRFIRLYEPSQQTLILKEDETKVEVSS